jgi:hypothetical protein
MTFKVEKEGRTLMQTESPRCIYDDETCRQMRAAGYKVTLDGKAYPPRNGGKKE